MLTPRPASPVNFRTLDLNLLRVFDEVMLERNLTRAAGNLAMTQPAVSNALKRLRESLHDDLFLRVGYGVEPTPRALELWPAVSAALARLRQAMVVDADFDPADSRETFVLATADATASLLVPHLVRPLAGNRPGAALWPSALAGALLLLVADMVVRVPVNSQELRLGVVTALLGAPFFLWLVVKGR
jgi:DNA-binding transcriptional LysR family regulator